MPFVPQGIGFFAIGISPLGTPPVAALTSDSPGVITQTAAQNQWGIFLNGAAVVQPDTVISVDVATNDRISNYQLESGAFETYDKVEMPFEAQIVMAVGGDQARRTAFLTALDAIQQSLDLYDIVTPEYTWASVNVVNYRIERAPRAGANLILARLYVEQVNVNAVAAFSNTQNPAAQANQDTGQVQPQTPTPQQYSAASAGAF